MRTAETLGIATTTSLVLAFGVTAALTLSPTATPNADPAPYRPADFRATEVAFSPDEVVPGEVTTIYVDDLSCGTAGDYALGCYRGTGTTIELDTSLLAPTAHRLLEWVTAHETAHVYGATECEADDYAYQVTANATIYHQGSAYAHRCGNFLPMADVIQITAENR